MVMRYVSFHCECINLLTFKSMHFIRVVYILIHIWNAKLTGENELLNSGVKELVECNILIDAFAGLFVCHFVLRAHIFHNADDKLSQLYAVKRNVIPHGCIACLRNNTAYISAIYQSWVIKHSACESSVRDDGTIWRNDY